MAAKNQQGEKEKKRKIGGAAVKFKRDGSASKKPKLSGSNAGSNSKKVIKKTTGKPQQDNRKRKFPEKSNNQESDLEPGVKLSKREGRLKAKELAEERKKKRKPHFTLEQELASLWEKMRCRDIAKEERSKLISNALQKMKGKIPEIAGSHVSSRVLQTCVKYCSQTERDAVFEELRPNFLSLSSNAYAVHLVKKLLDSASKTQLAGVISSLRGHVEAFLRHMVGSVVIEHVYNKANAAQKQELMMELYSTELKLFKDLAPTKESRLEDIISKLGLHKSSVLRHMSSVIQPILEKGIVDHSIIHRLLIEYLSIADKSSAADIIQQLSGKLLVRMIHTRDGSRLGMLCLKHGSAKQRKKIIKGMKGYVSRTVYDQFGCMVLVGIVSFVDDTKLVTKAVIPEIEIVLDDLLIDKCGRRLLLQLLHPNCSRYLSPDDMACLNLSIPSLDAAKAESESKTEEKSSEEEGSAEEDAENDGNRRGSAEEGTEARSTKRTSKVGKKDPLVRRRELLVKSGLAEKLVDICIENAWELLRSNFGRDIIYEVATGGSDDILRPTLSEKLENLHDAIASLAAGAISEEAEEEHVLKNFLSSCTLKKLVLDCPDFATTLWDKAFKGKCESLARGHSSRVVNAFWESSNPDVRKLVEKELQPLIESGVLKARETKQSATEG